MDKIGKQFLTQRHKIFLFTSLVKMLSAMIAAYRQILQIKMNNQKNPQKTTWFELVVVKW